MVLIFGMQHLQTTTKNLEHFSNKYGQTLITIKKLCFHCNFAQIYNESRQAYIGLNV